MWPATRWERLAVAQGEQGERLYDWGAQRVVESQDDLPGREVWLLARVAAQRYVVEQCLEESKGETGLDEYEVRRWDSAAVSCRSTGTSPWR